MRYDNAEMRNELVCIHELVSGRAKCVCLSQRISISMVYLGTVFDEPKNSTELKDGELK